MRNEERQGEKKSLGCQPQLKVPHLANISLIFLCGLWRFYFPRTALHPSKWMKSAKNTLQSCSLSQKVHNGWAKTRKDTEGLFHMPVWPVRSLLLSCHFLLDWPSFSLDLLDPPFRPCTYWSSTSKCCTLGVHGIRLATFYNSTVLGLKGNVLQEEEDWTTVSSWEASLKTVDSHTKKRKYTRNWIFAAK